MRPREDGHGSGSHTVGFAFLGPGLAGALPSGRRRVRSGGRHQWVWRGEQRRREDAWPMQHGAERGSGRSALHGASGGRRAAEARLAAAVHCFGPTRGPVVRRGDEDRRLEVAVTRSTRDGDDGGAVKWVLQTCDALRSRRKSSCSDTWPPQDGHVGRASAGMRGYILLSHPLPRQPNYIGNVSDVKLLLDGRLVVRRWCGGHASKLVVATDFQAISMREEKFKGKSLALRASNGDACVRRSALGVFSSGENHILAPQGERWWHPVLYPS
uniref:Uncharacterized protein n=1 Tax=Oryza punctata TaxID=4537 RepID=A0A0E0JMH4_ORYPU